MKKLGDFYTNASYRVAHGPKIVQWMIKNRYLLWDVCVGEVKVNNIILAAETECFYNMMAQASSLSLKLIEAGEYVDKAKMYGVVVSTEDHKARLFMLDIDFQQKSCTFK